MIAVVADITPADVTAELVTVTPDMALEWLETCNTHNRPVRESFVAKLVRAIVAGEWQVNGEAIKFSTEGVLLDGQHRLWACVQSDTPIVTAVVRGVEMSAQVTMDTGVRRTLADQLKLRGLKSSKQLSAALAILWRLETGKIMSTDTPSITEALAIMDANPGLEQSVVRAESWRLHVRMSGAVLATVHHRALDIAAEDAEDFFTRLASGAELPEHDARFVFRRYVDRRRTQRSVEPQWVTHAVLIKAWNAYRQGRKVQTLSFRPGGATPEQFPEMV